MARAVTPRDPQRSPVAALSALLEAEKTRSHKSSFALLSTEALRKYPTLEDWSNHQIDLPQVTGFSDVTAVDGQVSALVEHMPGIDPFIGIQFAQERQTWHAQREGDGWLLDSEPLVEPIIPPADLATSAAEKWVEAVRACDQKAARESQAVANLFGISEGASKVCGSKESYSVAPPVAVTPSPETSALVAQYGAGILRYVQTVAVTGGSKSFVAYLVPIGDVWKVIGVND